MATEVKEKPMGFAERVGFSAYEGFTPPVGRRRFEYYNTGDDTGAEFGRVIWWAQSFTPSVAHNITSVKLKLSQGMGGSPGLVTVSIRATDVSGQPTGPDLTSGTYNGDTLPIWGSPDWFEINLTPYALAKNTKYAIVVRCAGGWNALFWASDGTSPTYVNGWWMLSGDSGSSWADITTDDAMFEEWGE